MLAVVQRVTRATVVVESNIVGEIGHGLLVLLGIARGDQSSDVQWMVKKIAGLRIFADDAGRMNLDIAQVRGAILLVSQFTLLADLSSGNRPGFGLAEDPAIARVRCNEVAEGLTQKNIPIARGQFAASMAVSLTNDGPVTILLDSRSPGGSVKTRQSD